MAVSFAVAKCTRTGSSLVFESRTGNVNVVSALGRADVADRDRRPRPSPAANAKMFLISVRLKTAPPWSVNTSTSATKIAAPEPGASLPRSITASVVPEPEA